MTHQLGIVAAGRMLPSSRVLVADQCNQRVLRLLIGALLLPLLLVLRMVSVSVVRVGLICPTGLTVPDARNCRGDH